MSIQSDRFWMYLRDRVKLSLSEKPVDWYDSYLKQMLASDQCSTMPPSPGVARYTLTWKDIGTGVWYTVKPTWHEFVTQDLMKNLPKWQLIHRSRDVALAAQKYQAVELQRRVGIYEDSFKSVEGKLLPEAKMEEIWLNMITKTKDKYLSINWDHIKAYIAKHRRSSIGMGNLWGNWNPTREQIDELFNYLKGNLEMEIDKMGYWNNNRFNIGMRARANKLDLKNLFYIDNEIKRSRIITFGPDKSVEPILIPNKDEWYAETIQDTIEIIDPVGEYYMPFLLKGEIYGKFRDTLNEMQPGEEYHAYDGRGWDSNVAHLMGKAFRPDMMMAAVPQLPTGEFRTSWNGTIANVIDTRTVPGKHFVLGDDHGYIGKHHTQLKSPEMEEDLGDTKTWYFLGNVFKPDPDVPRISGLKLTSDRSTLRISLGLSPNKREETFQEDRDWMTSVVWAMLFFGKVGDHTLVDFEAKWGEAEFFGASEFVAHIVDVVKKEHVKLDLLAPAEERGVRKFYTTRGE